MQINSHLSTLVYDVAAKYGDREALIYKNFGSKQWKSCSWNQFAGIVKQVSNAMASSRKTRYSISSPTLEPGASAPSPFRSMPQAASNRYSL